MKIEQYKSDVRTLVLSDSFKQGLKEKMAKEYALVATETTAKPWMKYSKYIATAACLVLIVATIGVVSLMGDNFRLEKSADNVQEANMSDDALYSAGDAGTDTDTTEYDDMPVTEEEVIEEDVVAEEEEDAVIEEEEVEEAAPVVEEAPAEEAPAENATGESEEDYKSSYAPEDYDGEYYAEDYIVANDISPDYTALNVATSMKLLSDYSENDDFSPLPTEEEAPETTVTIEDEEPVADLTFGYEDISYGEFSLNTLRYLDTVNFVKFTVEDVYSADDAVALTSDDSFETEKTLYKINLTYDYLNGTELDSDLYLAYPGTTENQLAGRPVLAEGEKYLTCLTFDNGYAEMLFELSYAVHRINGLDIAYHLVGGNGIDPGYTNMGMLDVEREVVTTTLNNPAVYTHKAAVKELTRYIKRKWGREDYTFTDFGNTSSSGDNAETEESLPIIPGELVSELDLTLTSGEVSVSLNGAEFDPKGNGSEFYNELNRLSNGSGSSSENSYLSFIGGRISFSSSSTFGGNITEISMSEGTTLPIKVNGVGIGDSMDALVEAFSIRHNVDGILTLRILTANADGVAYDVAISVVDNIITEIVIK